jgi:hypothetical protein
MTTESYLSRGLDYLGELGSKLRDLQGTATLAHELIQNAEDAIKDIQSPSLEQATISFRIDQKELIVENGGVFSDCGQQSEPVCPRKIAGQRPCDFHSFRNIGGAAKRHASHEQSQNGRLKGAFGFGFTAVYQVTDHPQLISNGRHWILQDHEGQDRRIAICDGSDCEHCSASDLPGTRFVLPWAFDESSEVRLGLTYPIVAAEKPQELVEELETVLPRTILFLDHIRQLRVFWTEQERMSVTVSDRSETVISVSTNGEEVRWALLTHDFGDVAASLRSDHPAGEKKPSSEVKIAVPQGSSSDGLFFAYLPTQVTTGVPFHINADFFPSNNRKRLLLENDYQGEWNRAAIQAGAIALSSGLLSLRSHLGPECFWELIQKVKDVADDGSLLGTDYWETLLPVLGVEPVIPASDSNWCISSDVYFVSKHDEERFGELYKHLGIRTIDPAVAAHQTLLTSSDVGVRNLDLATVTSRLFGAGISKTKSLEQLPSWLQESENRQLLWQLIGELFDREEAFRLPDQHSGSIDLLEMCSIIECTDEVFRTISDSFEADAQTRELFETLCPELHFANDHPVMLAALSSLIPDFSVQHAVHALTNRQSEQERITDESQSTIPEDLADEVLAWFNQRIEELRTDSSLITKLKSLAICPTHDGLQSFNNVVLPGGFSDPIGVTSVANEESLNTVRPLVRLLQLNALSLADYVTDRLPDAFQQRRFDPDTCTELLEMLSQHQGEFFDSEVRDNIRSTLSGLECISCSDGELRSVDDGLYFFEELTRRVLGNSEAYVADSVCTPGIKNFLKWLGVESRPRLDRVVECIIETAELSATPDQQMIDRVLVLFEHLGGRADELDQNTRLRDKLKSNKWLPSNKRVWDSDSEIWRTKKLEWAAPHDLHHYRCRHLVETVASFVQFPKRVQYENRKLLAALGMIDSPNARTVITHLRVSAQSGSRIEAAVYEFLNKALKDSELYPSDFKTLTDLKCLYEAEGDRFVKPNECFSEDHPFGSYRVLLDSSVLTSLEVLLKALRVRPCPTWKDAVSVLLEISQSDDARLRRKISSSDKRAVVACWRLIESALRDDEESTEFVCEQLKVLAKVPVVCRADNLMELPQNVFFRDRDHLAEAFSDSLQAELIAMPQGATDALTKAGVRRLSDVTTTRIVYDDADQRESLQVATRISERTDLLVNVVETCRSARQRASLPDFKTLRVLKATSLTVELTFSGFQRPLPPVAQEVVAVIERSPDSLWYCMDEGFIPWDTIAFELARLCLDTDDVAQLSAAISAAIEPESLRRAQRKLSQLGFPSIEVDDETPEEIERATAFGMQVLHRPDELLHEETREDQFATADTSVDSSEESQSADDVTTDSSGEEPVPTPTSGNHPTGNTHQDVGFTRGQMQRDKSRQQTTASHPRAATPAESKREERFVDWLVTQPGATDRRKSKIQQTSNTEPRRIAEFLVRKQRVNRIPKEDVFRYLSGLYTSDDFLMCQMMTDGEDDVHKMPFRKKNRQMYWGKEELFNRDLTQELASELPEDARLHLFLCPTCAAIYTEFIATSPGQQRKLLEWITSDSDRTVFEVDCSLGGTQPRRFLHFHPKHLDDIRAVNGVADDVLARQRKQDD